MAQKSINLGTGYNTKDGDSVRDAFNKVNQNFTELYTLTGGTVADLTELAQDYSAAMFVNATHTGITVNYDDDNNVLELTGFDGDYNSLSNQPTLFDPSAVSQSIIPDTDVTYDLGSATNRFRDLYLSGSTIDLGGTTLSIVGGELQLGGVKVPTTTDVAASIAAGSNPFDQNLNTTDSPTFAGITFSDATTQSTAWTGSAPGFTYSELGGTSEIGVTADTFDFGDGKTIDMQNSSVLFNDSSIQDFAPGNVYAKSGQYLYVTGKYSGGSATNVAFTYDTNINNARQTFYGKTEFANNGQAPIVDFTGASVTNLDNITVPADGTLDINVSDSVVATTDTVKIGIASIETGASAFSVKTQNNKSFTFDNDSQRIECSGSTGFIKFGTATNDGNGNTADIELWAYGGDGVNGDVYISAGSNPTNNRWKFSNDGTATFPGNLELPGGTLLKAHTIAAPDVTAGNQGENLIIGAGVGSPNGSVILGDDGNDLFDVVVGSNLLASGGDGFTNIGTDIERFGTVNAWGANYKPTTSTGGDGNVYPQGPDLTELVPAIQDPDTGNIIQTSLFVLNSADSNDNKWVLPDGVEGQVVHFVPGTGAAIDQHIVRIENWRRWDEGAGVAGEWRVETDLDWLPFQLDSFPRYRSMATAIFVNGAWQTDTGWID